MEQPGSKEKGKRGREREEKGRRWLKSKEWAGKNKKKRWYVCECDMCVCCSMCESDRCCCVG